MSTGQIKQWIIIRKDLNMRKGKMCSQAAHASMAAILPYIHENGRDVPPEQTNYPVDTVLSDIEIVNQWLLGAFTKICLGVDSEEELDEIYQKAVAGSYPASLITDSGLTEFSGVPTKTAVAIGPCLVENALPIVGHLKLL